MRNQEFPCNKAEGITCAERKCLTCGWNPEVSEMRIRRIRAELRVRQETDANGTATPAVRWKDTIKTGKAGWGRYYV